MASLRELAEPPPVIYVTAMQEGRVAVAALKAGAVDYVAKDVQGEIVVLLQRAVDAAFEAVMLRRAKAAAEAESKRNWLLAECIVDTIRDPLVVLEHDMTIVAANKAFLTKFGITAAETQGRRVADLGQRQWDVPALRDLMGAGASRKQAVRELRDRGRFSGSRPPGVQLECAENFSTGKPCPSDASGLRGRHRPQAARA
ncbi:MAG: PAS domain-containing protein [Pseudomonadota bacterium]